LAIPDIKAYIRCAGVGVCILFVYAEMNTFLLDRIQLGIKTKQNAQTLRNWGVERCVVCVQACPVKIFQGYISLSESQQQQLMNELDSRHSKKM
jgi:hypothetical protein